MRLTPCLLLLLAAGDAFAQSPGGAVHGRVVEKGKPDPDAWVTLSALADASSPPLQASTDDDGAFAFDALKPGRYLLALVPKRANEVTPPRELEVAAALADVTIERAAVARLTGRLSHAKGEGVAFVRVTVRASQGREYRTATADDGYFTLSVPPGDYQVLARSVAATAGAWKPGMEQPVGTLRVGTGQAKFEATVATYEDLAARYKPKSEAAALLKGAVEARRKSVAEAHDDAGWQAAEEAERRELAALEAIAKGKAKK